MSELDVKTILAEVQETGVRTVVGVVGITIVIGSIVWMSVNQFLKISAQLEIIEAQKLRAQYNEIIRREEVLAIKLDKILSKMSLD